AEQLRRNHRSLTLFYGARSVKDLLYLQELKVLNVKLHLTTVDGSAGETGLVTEAVGRVYSAQKPGLVACCGPTGLLKAVQQWALPRGIACELSVEETMGCGTGVCLGCVVQDHEGHYRRACIEGPVFEGASIRL
ncbi:MAG TPA: dihydroorotate dehydrogenase electron transfer subunit, partial [bacterium]|nr:dihydroorotate dehydrogenase electron transfer subunit [bacterium]